MISDVRITNLANNGFQDVTAGVSFSGEGALSSVGVALSSFFASYGSSTDHEVKTISGYAETVSILPDGVTSQLTGTLQDSSGHRASVALAIAFPAQLAGS